MPTCRVHWVAKFDQRWKVEEHHHDYFHLQVIVGGVARMRIGEEEWMVRSQQIYFIPPKTSHILEDTSEGAVPLRLYDVKFSVTDPALCRALQALPRPLRIENHTRFLAKLESLLDESYSKRPFAHEVINNQFTLMAVQLVRQFTLQGDVPGLPVMDGSNHYYVKGINMPKLLQFIQSNLGQIITLDSLARMAGINKTTLTGVFKKCFGITPMRYVNQERLSYARELLANTDLSVSEIAVSIGFTNHNFSRYFRAQHECTPIDYRVRHRDNRFYPLEENWDDTSIKISTRKQQALRSKQREGTEE